MFKTAYDTSACVYYRSLDDIQKVLGQVLAIQDDTTETLSVAGPITDRQGHPASYHACVLIDGVLDIPYFAHPMVITSLGGMPIHHVISDARDSTRRDPMGGFKVTSLSDYSFTRIRTILQMRWLIDFSQSSSASYQAFAIDIYSRWISETIARRFNLDITQTMQVKAIAGFMFISMHKQDKEIQDYERPELQMYITKNCKVPTTVMATLQMDNYIDDVKEFCEILSSQLDTNRLAGLNPATLFGLMKGSWFGKNAGEIVNVSLEHPPTFNGLIYAAAGSPSFQKTSLGKLVKENLKSNEAGSFIHSIAQLINNKDS